MVTLEYLFNHQGMHALSLCYSNNNSGSYLPLCTSTYHSFLWLVLITIYWTGRMMPTLQKKNLNIEKANIWLKSAGLNLPLLWWHLCSQTGLAGMSKLLCHVASLFLGENTEHHVRRRLRAGSLAISWAKYALPLDSWAKRKHESKCTKQTQIWG